MNGRRIGILGGTFDPIHCGHLDIGLAAQRALDLTEVDVIPAHVPPHRPQPAASSYHRFAMVALAVAHRRHWKASDLELRSDDRSYTTTTLHKFGGRGYMPSELFFIIGADAFAEIGYWRDYPAILDLANFAVVSRPAFPVSGLVEGLPDLAARMMRVEFVDRVLDRPTIVLIDAVTADVSSTAIRSLRAAGQSISGLVPPGVQQHIDQHGLYASTTRERRDGQT
jgi:nicotinate-nucleotide adenylyltransferase